MKYINYFVSLAVIAAECIFFAFGMSNLLAYLLTVIPLAISFVISVIDEVKTIKREKKIKVLRRMYEIVAHLPAYFAEMYRVQEARKRSGWSPVNASAEYCKVFESLRPEILEFISLFGLKKQREEILSCFRSTPEKAKLLLNRLETDMKLTDYERLLIKAKT